MRLRFREVNEREEEQVAIENARITMNEADEILLRLLESESVRTTEQITSENSREMADVADEIISKFGC